jgi:hypothetical protein
MVTPEHPDSPVLGVRPDCLVAQELEDLKVQTYVVLLSIVILNITKWEII